METWTNNVDDQGYAALQAAAKVDNLAGDIEALGGSIDAAAIKTGQAANGPFREMVQILTGLVNWYSQLDESMQNSVFWIGTGVAAVTLLGGAFMLAVPKIAAFRAALHTLNSAYKGTAIAGGVVGLALTAAVVVLGAFGAAQTDAKAAAESLAATLDEQTGAITANTRAQVADMLQKNGSIKAAKELGISASDLVDAYLQVPRAVDSVSKSMDAARDPNGAYRESLKGTEGGLTDMAINLSYVEKALRDGVPATENARRRYAELQEATESSADATDGSTEAHLTAADAYLENADAASTLEDEILTLFDSMNALNGIGQDASGANIAYQQSLADVDEQIRLITEGTEGYIKTLDIGTEAGRTNRGMLDELAGSNQAAAKAQFDLDGNTANYKSTLEAGRQAVVDRAIALGANADEANPIADEISKIPNSKEWEIIAVTSDAEARLNRIQNLINGIGQTSQLHISTGPGGQGGITQADGGVVSFYANGGMRENHVAQMEKAGAMRVWAEPETGGEAYIPMAPAKRGRSTAILQTVAEEFGYQLVRAGAQAFADGSTPATSHSIPAAQASRAPEIIQVVLPDGRVLAQVLREYNNSLK